MKRILSFYIIFFCVLCSFADGISKWTLYPAYKNITSVVSTGKNIFAISSGNLFSYNTEDNSLQTYTKNDVLTDMDIKHIAWVKSIGKLVIVYESGIIDFLSLNGDVSTITDIAYKEMTDDKTINDVFVSGQYVYLATGFGIIKLNARNGYVSDTYKLGVKVDAVAQKGDYVYARTALGVMKGKMTDNLLDKSVWAMTLENWNTICPNNNLSYDYGTIFFDQTNRCYWGNNKEGKLTRYEIVEGKVVEKTPGVAPDGPFEDMCTNVSVRDGVVYALPGGWGFKIGDNSIPNKYVSILENGKWSYLDMGDYDNKLPYYGMNCITVDPRDKNHLMVGAKTGVYEFQNRKFIRHYGIENGLKSASSDNSYCLCNNIMYDTTGRLWIMNRGDYRIKYMSADAKPSDDYQFKEVEKSIANPYDLTSMIFKNNTIWFVNSAYYYRRGLFNYDVRNDKLYEYPSEYNQDNVNLQTTYNCIDFDSENNIWIASTVGLLYLPASEIGNTVSPIYQHKVPRNDGTNYADYLLNNIDCFAVAIDKFDNKWVGTNSNGVYYISSDNNTEIYHFTKENSLLPSDIIYNISIDKLSGKVYFATDKGLCSYQGDVRGNDREVNDDNVYAYPNPVTPDYDGEISITGLYPNAHVKIMSTSGTLIDEGTALGGAYRWNGKSSDGRRVASGIYFVAATDESGNEGVVTKIAVVR